MSQPIASAYVDLSIDNSQFKADVGAANDLMLEFLGKMESAIGNFNMEGVNAAFTEMAASVRVASEATANLRQTQADAVESRVRLTEAAQQARLAMQEEANAARLVTEAERADAIASGAEQKRQLATASSEVALRLKEEANAAKIAATEERSAQSSQTAEQKRQLAAESQAVTLRLKEEAAAAKQTSEAEQQMASSTKEAGNAASEASGHFSVFGGALSFILGQLAYSAFSMVAQGFKDIATGLVSQNAALETASVAFTTLDKSASDANAEIGVLKDYANHTSFEFAGVKQSAIELQTAGSSAHDAETEIKKLGDAVAAMGGGDVQLEQLAEDVAQVQVKGHLAGQEVLQFANAGIPMVQILADKFGKTTDEIDTMISSGLIPAGTAIDALNGYIGTTFQGAADAQSKTFSGMVSTLQDWFNQSLQIVGQPLFEHLEGALTTLIDKLNDPAVDDALAKIGAVLGDVIGGAIDWLMNTGIPGMVSAWGTLSTVLSTIWDVVSGVASVFTTIADAAFGWGQGIVNSLADGISSAAQAVIDSLGGIGDIITGLLETHSPPKLLPELANWGKQSAQVWLDGWTAADFSVLNGVVDPVKAYLDSLVSMGAISKTAVAPAVQAVTDAMTQMIQTIREGGTVGQDAFNKLAAAAGPAGSEARKLAEDEIAVLEATQKVDAAQKSLDAATHDVKNAQDDLNAQMAHYDDLLKPIQDKITGITDAENALTEAQQRQRLDNTIANAPLDREKASLEITIEQHNYNTKQQKLNDDISKQQDVLNNKHATAEEKAQAQYQIEQDRAQLRINEIDDKEKVAQLDQASKDAATAQLAVLGKQKLDAQDQLKLINDQKTAAKNAGDARVKAAQDEVTAAKDVLTAAQKVLTTNQDRLKNEQAVVSELTKENQLIAAQEQAIAQAAGGGGKGGGGGAKKPAGGATTKPKPPTEWHEPEMIANTPEATAGPSALETAIGRLTAALRTLVTEGLDFVSPILTAFDGLVQEAARIVGEVFAHAIEVGGKVFKDLEPTFITIRGAIIQIINAITTEAPGFEKILFGIIDIVGSVARNVGAFLSPLIKGFGDAIQAVAPHARDFLSALGRFLSLAGELIGKLRPVAEFMGSVLGEAFRILGTVGGFVLDVLTNVVNFISDQLQSALNGTNPVVNAVTDVFTTLGNFIGSILLPIFETIVGWIVKNWPAISLAIQVAWDSVISPVLKAIGDFITGTLLPTIQNIVNWIVQHWPDVSNAIQFAWNNVIQPAFKAISDFIGSTLQPVIKGIVDFVVQHWPDIQNAIDFAWNKIIQPAFKGISDFVGNTLLPAITGLVDFVKNNFHFFGDVIKSVIDAVNVVLGPFKTVIDGISSAIDTLLGKSQSIKNAQAGLAGLAQAVGGVAGGTSAQPGAPTPNKNFADGGVVPGDYYGQNVRINAHAGEVYHGLNGQYGPTLNQLTQGMVGLRPRFALPGADMGRSVQMPAGKTININQVNHRTMYNANEALRDIQRLMYHAEGPG